MPTSIQAFSQDLEVSSNETLLVLYLKPLKLLRQSKYLFSTLEKYYMGAVVEKRVMLNKKRFSSVFHVLTNINLLRKKTTPTIFYIYLF